MSYPQNTDQPYPAPQSASYGPLGSDPNQPPKKGNGCLWIVLACLLGGGVLAVICCGVGSYYLAQNAKNLAVGLARGVAVNAINGSDLSDEDKKEIVAQVDRVIEAYKRGEIDEKDLENILKEVENSPLIPLGVVYVMDKQYIDKSGLSDEEKADARKQLQRLVRGGLQKKISNEDIEKLMKPLMQKGSNGEEQLKPTLTDEEIRTFVAGAKKLADDAEIPDEEFKVDIGDEVKRIVDRGLGEAEDEQEDKGVNEQ